MLEMVWKVEHMEDIKKETEQIETEQSKRCHACGAIWNAPMYVSIVGDTCNIIFCPSCGTKI